MTSITTLSTYKDCKFGNFREGFIFARSFVKIKTSQIVEISLSLTDVVYSCPSRDFEM